MHVRRISYLLPPPSPILPALTDDRVNMLKPTAAATNTKSFLQPRRDSISLTLPQTSTTQFLQPKRRVSIETLLPEFNSHMITPFTVELKSRVQCAISPLWGAHIGYNVYQGFSLHCQGREQHQVQQCRQHQLPWGAVVNSWKQVHWGQSFPSWGTQKKFCTIAP